MRVYLIEDTSFEIVYRRTHDEDHVQYTGSENFMLDSVHPAKHNINDFDVKLLTAIQNCLERRDVMITTSFTVTDRSPPTVEIRVQGPFLSRLLNEYKEPLKMRLTVAFRQWSGNSMKLITTEMEATTALGGDWIFEDNIEMESTYFVDQVAAGILSVELIPDGAGSSNLPDSIQMNRKFLEEGMQSDFVLVSENDVHIRCHKLFLAGHSPVFFRMFQTDCKEFKEGACTMRKSEEGVRAFLRFIYYASIEDPLESPTVALELLELGHEYDIPTLENAMKEMFLKKPDTWFSVDVAVLLFHRSLKVNGYEDLKRKVVQVIKAKPEGLNDSAVCDDLFKEDPKAAKELLSLCLQKKG
ncbi:BTB and MATH domain-containing protein 42 [Orchesella cincta]|uniref:BTB and MATH domain-containing protein 42 n=1 Tax=Orchesella cincta TaxID=48709 RepID=A0A1D2MTZ4_ORCCI|nr:BTB and MATH domain-containing protein 42 [Orchesella cincta]